MKTNAEDEEEPDEAAEAEPEDDDVQEADWYAEKQAKNREEVRKLMEAEAAARAAHVASDHHPSDRQHHSLGTPHHHSRLP